MRKNDRKVIIHEFVVAKLQYDFNQYQLLTNIINNNNSLIIEYYSIPAGLSSSHVHLGCTNGWNDSVRSVKLLSAIC